VHTRLTDPDLTNHDRGFEVMMRAVLVISGAAGRAMTARGHGRIINVSSTAGFVTLGSYSAMKAWVTSFSESLAVELRGSGVHVTAVCPGYVRTEFHQRGNVSTSKIPDFLWVPIEPTVRTALRDSERGRVVSIPSARYKVLIWLARHAPKAALRGVSAKLASGRGIPADSAETRA
jgi:short-subunit dehydrogenase